MTDLKRREEILEKYKDLYKYYHKKEGRVWPIAWGFEHGDGWLTLVEKLSSVIQYHVEEKQKIDPEFPSVEVHQCKEKFGKLRFYTNGTDDFVRGAITLAEVMSGKICEICGLPGKLYQTGWWRVRCDSCEEKRQKEMQEIASQAEKKESQ